MKASETSQDNFQYLAVKSGKMIVLENFSISFERRSGTGLCECADIGDMYEAAKEMSGKLYDDIVRHEINIRRAKEGYYHVRTSEQGRWQKNPLIRAKDPLELISRYTK